MHGSLLPLRRCLPLPLRRILVAIELPPNNLEPGPVIRVDQKVEDRVNSAGGVHDGAEDDVGVELISTSGGVPVLVQSEAADALAEEPGGFVYL